MPYIPRELNLVPNTDGDPTYRMSMLPFGTYANPDGNGEHFGFAVPGAIQEPLNALARLFGTPSHPGTLWNGPDYGVASDNPERSVFPNKQDMATLGATFYGGNALSPIRLLEGATAPEIAARALSDTGKPSLMGSAITGAEGNTPIGGYRGSNQARPIDAPRSRYWASTSPEVASGYATSPYGFDAPNVTPANFSFENPMTVDAGGSYWAQIPHNGGTTTTDNLARLAEANGHDGLIVRNVLDEMAGNGMPADSILALKRGTVTSPLTGETLFSDGLPSLFGSALYQDQAPRNALLTY